MRVVDPNIPSNYHVHVADKADYDGTWQMDIYRLPSDLYGTRALIQVRWITDRQEALNTALKIISDWRAKNEVS